MTTKLTLTVESTVIEKAKLYAKKNGHSLSELVESYLSDLISEEESKLSVSSKLKGLIGAVQLPKHFDEKKELQNYFSKKHL